MSELRNKKCSHVFDVFLDTNGDGYIDKEDFDIVINKSRKLRKWDPEDPELKRITATWYQILEGLLEELDVNKDGRVSREEWSAIHDKYANKNSMAKWQILYQNLVYEYLNPQNKPGGFTKEDYVEAVTYFGEFEQEDASAAFEKMSNGKEVITEDEFRQIWREYFYSDDPHAIGNNMCVLKQ